MHSAALAATLVTAVTSLVICVHFGWQRTLTVSNHVAQRVWSSVLFGVVIAATAAVMAAYTWTWLRPRAGLSWFTVAVLLAVCGLLVLIGVFPRTMSWVGTVHHRISWMCLTAMVVGAFALVADTWGHAAGWLRAFDAAFLAYVVALIVIRFTRFLKPYYLYWETSFFFGFFALWLTAT